MDEGNGKFNLMLLCWGEGHSSAVHDHADAHCFMKMLDGQLKEVRFAWPDKAEDGSTVIEGDGLEVIGETVLKTDSVCYINGNSRNNSFAYVSSSLVY